MDFLPIVLLLGLVSFAISVVATSIIKRVAPRIGFVDKPGHRKIHQNPKPLGGGIAIFLALAIPMLAGLLAIGMLDLHDPGPGTGLLHGARQALALHSDGIKAHASLAGGLLIAMTLIHLLGLWDDKMALGPFVKLAIQLAIITCLVVFFGFRALTALGTVPSVIITVLWIAGIVNAFNFLDNMDGLSAGVAAVCSIAFLLSTLLMPQPQWFVATLLAMLVGAAVGFLCYNFNPASIFMGDSGSTLIGLVLGALTVRTTYLPPDRSLAAGWWGVLAPLIVLAVPLYDLIVVSIIRISRGKSPFVGDTNHLSHRLVARGMSRRTAVLCIWLMTAATSTAAILLPHVDSAWAAILIFVQTLLVLGLVALLEQHPLPAASSPSGGGEGGREGEAPPEP